MSESNKSYEDDVGDFLRGLGDFLKASPNENQYIYGQILKQIKEGAEFRDIKHLEGEHGYEEIVVLQVGGLVAKRIFHPRDVAGVDFAVSKLGATGLIGTSVVQVKRNHGKNVFTLIESGKTRELTQLRKLRRWPSSYYLMVDETSKPPLDCFVLTAELVSIIQTITGRKISDKNLHRVNIPNESVHKCCRGTHMFYKAFYECRRGSWNKMSVFQEKALEYVSETMRALVEVLVKSKDERVWKVS